MTPQVKKLVFVIILIGISITNCKKLHGSENQLRRENYTDDKNDNSTIHKKSFENVGILEAQDNYEVTQTVRKPQKREQRTFGQVLTLTQPRPRPKPKPKQTTIEAPYPQRAPYPKEAPYKIYSNHPTHLVSTEQENNWRKESDKPQIVTNSLLTPLVATNIEIRRAVPFENDFITRHYASRFSYPPKTLDLHDDPDVYPVPFYSEKNNNGNENVALVPKPPHDESYSPITRGLNTVNYTFLPSLSPPQSFLPNSADELNRLRNPFTIPQVDHSQTFAPSSSSNYDNLRLAEPPGFVPWIPPGYEHLQQFAPLDRFASGAFASAPPPSQDFNVEVSEIGEPAFIVPENVGKVDIVIPPPFAPLRTYGLSINDAQITRNEVRKDNGEFLSSYTTAEGTTRLDSGSLVPTADGDQVLVLKGSYSFTSPEGLRFRVDYTADETGYHATQVPVSVDASSS